MREKPTIRRVDTHLATTVRRLRTMARSAHTTTYVTVRSMRPGPNLLKHMSVGLLAAEATRAWISNNTDTALLPMIAAELKDRGFNDTAAAVIDASTTDAIVPEVDDIFDTNAHMDTKLAIVATAIDRIADIVDNYDRHAMSNKEVLDDLSIMNAPPEAIDAYAQALGSSDTPPSVTVATELDNSSHGIIREQTPILTPPEREQEMSL